ncbi:glycosyltransferase [Natrinema zhouii]|uniref:Glycosyltransferase n=1 Tax=Natrinema zhouii TaxID=1710539 RepID=A0A7D6GQR4_9EURY|nr:glycosyltransferase [Natrinema zhouii]QLK26821.1 glycosyltransferase [Natrinema zhouii]
MNVLQVSKFYAPHVGGIEHVVQQLAEGLDNHGHDVTVLASARYGSGTREHINGIPVVRTSSLGTLLSTPLSPTYPIRLHELNDVDIIHIHLPNPLATVSELLANQTDASIFVTYHSDIVRQQIAGRVYQPILHRFLDRADQIITTSPRLRDNSAVLSQYRDNCAVVPLSVSLDEMSNPLSNSPSIDIDDSIVLFVGRLNYYKGVEYLIDAMSSVDGTLLVVGDGPRRQKLETQAANSDASVKFLGRVDDATLEACYTDADVFVLPSVEPSEAFGIVQLEAMAHGLPIVNTNLPTGVPWVSKHGETGLTVPPRDSDALASAISELLTGDKRRQLFVENARNRVLEMFLEDKMIESTIELYKRAI